MFEIYSGTKGSDTNGLKEFGIAELTQIHLYDSLTLINAQASKPSQLF